jgi:hypothetical protein
MTIFWYDKEKNVYKTHIEALKSKKRCWLYYYDDFYQTVNWKIEPTLSLEHLYKLRAQEIRDTYEHVILCLSGGIDSRTILETFHKNKIHIDEIVSVGAFSQDEYAGSSENNNDEIYYNVKTLLNDLYLPNTKITYIDYSELFDNINNFSIIKDYGNEWVFHLGHWKSIHNFFWADFKKHVIKNDKKTCFILGEGKTQLNIFTVPFVSFSEGDVTAYCREYRQDNLYRENFYFGPTPIGAEIVKKQAYIMYDVFQKVKDKPFFMSNYGKLYNNIIYDNSLLKIPTRKSTNSVLSIRDKYIKRKTNSDLYRIYHDGLLKLNAEVGLNYQPHYTRPYYISEHGNQE